jgi:YHS domain-containing protein
MLKLRTVAGFVLLTSLFVFAGCSQEQPKAPSTPSPEQKAADQGPAADKSTEDLPGLKDLSPEDLAAAKKQEVCPVTGEKLGSMGKPYKVTVKGQTVFLCCDGCEEAITKDPDKYLAKLKKAD